MIAEAGRLYDPPPLASTARRVKKDLRNAL